MLKIGDTRTFEKIAGNWTIKNIHTKKCIFTLQLHTLKCKNCGVEQYDSRNYTFERIEELDNKGSVKYLGVSTCGRYILLSDYLTSTEIKNKIGVL